MGLDSQYVYYGEKYTNQDIRHWKSLGDAAYRYAMEYKGSFAFLLQARREARANGWLSIGMARGVLNCMLHDHGSLGGLPRPGEVPPELIPKHKIKLKSRFNGIYIWGPAKPDWPSSNGRNLSVAHYLNDQASSMYWLPEGVVINNFYPEQYVGPTFMPIVKSYCGQRPRSFKIGDLHPPTHRVCKTCTGMVFSGPGSNGEFDDPADAFR